MKALLQTVMASSDDDGTPEQKLALVQALRREYHAGMALQGLLSAHTSGNHDRIASIAVEAADALIAKLDEVQP